MRRHGWWKDYAVTEVPPELAKLFTELCVDLGFCLAPDDYEHLASNSWKRPEDMTDAIFMAEQMPEPFDLRLWRQVRDRVARYLAKTD